MNESITAADLRKRVLDVVERRRTAGSPVPEPQSLTASFDLVRYEPVTGFPWKRIPWSGAPPTMLPLDRRDYHLDELTALDYEPFVVNAYRVILGREPDPEGLKRNVASLQHGIPKVMVAARLRLSKEGRKSGVRIRGLVAGISAAAMRNPFRLVFRPFLRAALRAFGRIRGR